MSLEPLARDIDWLHTRLDEAIPSQTRDDLAQARAAAVAMLETQNTDARLSELSEDRLDAVLKTLAIRFHLRNKAEQLHITRVNRQRELMATEEKPRPESLAEAIGVLASRGVPLAQVKQILQELDIQPTLTAHPTESRRRSVIAKQDRIAELLMIRHGDELAVAEHRALESDVRQTLAQLLATDEIRSQRLDVLDEVRNGIHYLAGSIWQAVPGLYRDLADAVEDYYGVRPELPVFLRYRSWIGGDRDGNPFVTANRSASALAEMRDIAVAQHHDMLDELHEELSLSSRRVPIDPALLDSIANDEASLPLDDPLSGFLQHEPFRQKIAIMQMRLGADDYPIEKYIDDLRLIQLALHHAGLHETAERGGIADALVRARTFGFHLAALDFRQHSRVHEVVVSELLRIAGVATNYADEDEQRKRKILEKELTTSRPLLCPGQEVTAETRELLEGLQVFSAARERDPGAVGTYIISMAHDVSDVLEVLVLMREVGLWKIVEGQVHSGMDIAPLFETVDDLDASGETLRAMLASPAYHGHLSARDRFQEIMLGYSDSNKDGGYWAANWRLHTAQQTLARIAREANLTFRFFHGRGGTVARGGGRANRAILASPLETRNGRIRFTEQGEVISFRYAMPEIAHRHLEQIVHAMMLATSDAGTNAQGESELTAVMDEVALRSRAAYRDLIDDDDFWPLFIERSPVLYIGDLPIASRPVSRVGNAITFDNLRAIPWVFAWTQMRYNAPGWYGTGAAFQQLLFEDDAAQSLCRQHYAQGGSFRSFVDNAQQEMARARPTVAGWYTDDGGQWFQQRLEQEFRCAEQVILTITGQAKLLDNNPVIQQSIRERNEDTDVLNAIQVELLHRWRTSGNERPELKQLILLSVNALAAAMQSTG